MCLDELLLGVVVPHSGTNETCVCVVVHVLYTQYSKKKRVNERESFRYDEATQQLKRKKLPRVGFEPTTSCTQLKVLYH